MIIIVKKLGKPSPSVKWYKEGKEIEPLSSDDITITFESDSGSATLIIRHVSSKDSAKYTCVARNALGSCSTSASVNVQGINIILDYAWLIFVLSFSSFCCVVCFRFNCLEK